jgi:hypothetical protein
MILIKINLRMWTGELSLLDKMSCRLENIYGHCGGPCRLKRHGMLCF